MKNKKKILLIFGGPSFEYDVSCSSASSLVDGIDKSKYIIYCVGITRKGDWLLTPNNPSNINDGTWEQSEDNKTVILSNNPTKKGLYILKSDKTFTFCPIDIIFPIIHGKIGEDGIIQGLSELIDIPIVSTDLFTSICSYDKHQMNMMMKGLGIKVPNGICVNNKTYDYTEMIINLKRKEIKYPLIVKPSKGGSSIGISLVCYEKELKKAVNNAFKYDNNVIIEERIKGSEIKIGIFGLGKELCVSEISQVYVHGNGVEDYNCKYFSHNTTRYLPANISMKIKKEIEETSKKIYKEMNFSVYTRIDFILSSENVLYFNEINTIPGFTRYCSFPQMFDVAGISYEVLIDKLISLSLKDKKNIKEVME